MKNIKNLFIMLIVATVAAFGQTALTSTTLSNAITANQTSFVVASATGMEVNGFIYVIDKGASNKGELMKIKTISSTTLTVDRISTGTQKAHPTGSYVVISAPGTQKGVSFPSGNPGGSCTAASTAVTPYINITTGEDWLCSTSSLAWVPGFNNPRPKGMTATVASAAGAITPSGPYFHVTGTAAVTGFTLPVGFTSGNFCIIPDGAFTWTTAGNIAVAGTAVVNRTVCFHWDSVAGKFNPTYV